MNTTLTRVRVTNRPGCRVPWSWVYSYTAPVTETFKRPDMTDYVRQAGATVEFGRGLGDLIGMLRRKYPGIEITEAWKQEVAS